jgi:hypothetical protein
MLKVIIIAFSAMIILCYAVAQRQPDKILRVFDEFFQVHYAAFISFIKAIELEIKCASRFAM